MVRKKAREVGFGDLWRRGGGGWGLPPLEYVFPASAHGPAGFNSTAGNADRAALYELIRFPAGISTSRVPSLVMLLRHDDTRRSRRQETPRCSRSRGGRAPRTSDCTERVVRVAPDVVVERLEVGRGHVWAVVAFGKVAARIARGNPWTVTYRPPGSLGSTAAARGPSEPVARVVRATCRGRGSV